MKGWGANPPTDDMLMTRPLCCARMWGRTALVMRMRPKTLTSKTIRSWATELSSLAPDEPMPALFTRTSMRPDRSNTSRTAPATDNIVGDVERQEHHADPRLPRSRPAARPVDGKSPASSARAAASPIPPDAPVTSATRPVPTDICHSFSRLYYEHNMLVRA